MLEHMKNYMELFQKLSNWLKAGGKLFVHIFCHKSIPYDFDENENNSWMARYFFTGKTI
jgi:cyclopropane fatty-acyl-phospholipid synthase-like methyltransferase